MENLFVKAATMGEGSSFTENGAVSYATTGKELIDQFFKSGTAMGRPMKTVWAEQAKLHAESPEYAVKFPFYLRLITRDVNLGDGEKSDAVQKGQGLRDESFKRILWYAQYHPDIFYKNLHLLPVVGKWRDIFDICYIASEHNVLKSIDLDKVYHVIAEGIADESMRELVKKYLPRIRSAAQCTTARAKAFNSMAKGLAHYFGWTYKEYRLFKATGKAHEFQTVICKGLYKDIDWGKIPGKALLNLVSGKFLEKHKLEKSYLKWLDKQPVAKFNGYAYELGNKLSALKYPTLAQKMTIDKQFENLLKTGRKGGGIQGNVFCALDTSGSMTSRLGNSNVTAYDVCVSLGIYFSALNEGAFHNTVLMFDDTSTVRKLKGTFSEKWDDIHRDTTAWGSTNFLSCIETICEIRKKNPNIPLGDYPETLLVISDMQFNPAGGEVSNLNAAKSMLLAVFPEDFVEKFKIIWWYCTGRYTADFPSTMDDFGTYFFSGFDGAIISILLGGEMKAKDGKAAPTAEEVIKEALNQQVLQLVDWKEE